MIDVKNRIIKFPRRVISLFFISSVLLIPSCGSENKSSNISLLEEENEKTSHDHAGHNHGGHDHHGLEDAIDLDPITDPPNVSFEVEVLEGKVKDGFSRFKLSKGDVVEITVFSDKNDEVHLHVYDNMVDVGPGAPAVINVKATIPGIFEAELHSAGFRIFELQVS